MSNTREQTEGKWLSHSQLSKYRKCRWQWYAHYHEGIRIRGTMDDRLEIGTLVHAGLEGAFTFYSEHSNNNSVLVLATYAALAESEVLRFMEDQIEEERNEDRIAQLRELAGQAGEIAKRAIEWLDITAWEVVTVDGKPLIEALLKAPLGVDGWDGILGYTDIVLRERATGSVYVFDFKTREKFQDYAKEETAEQLAIYQMLLEPLGIELSGAATFQIRSRVPEFPKVLKNGKGLSKAKITTDWPTYLSAIEMGGFNPADYEGVKEWASQKEFFRLTKNYRSSVEIANIRQEIELVAAEMLREDLPVYRNLSPGFMGACGFCGVRELCLAELRDQDTKWLMRTKFRHKSEPNERVRLEDVEMEE